MGEWRKKDERQRKKGVDMVDKAELDAQYEETRLIIEELLEDGSDPDALYAIEHHFSADNFALLEKAAVEAFKLGYEVTDAEELEIETGETLMCCDVISESALNAELIDAQVEQLMKLAEKWASTMMVGARILKTQMQSMTTKTVMMLTLKIACINY